MPNNNRHENYDLLNLIGYGLSKFDTEFIKSYGFKTKSDFYQHIVKLGVAETDGVVKNRQDLFDGMEPGGKRKGWWQKGPIDLFNNRLNSSVIVYNTANQSHPQGMPVAAMPPVRI